jgi:hypothetical protein
VLALDCSVLSLAAMMIPLLRISPGMQRSEHQLQPRAENRRRADAFSRRDRNSQRASAAGESIFLASSNHLNVRRQKHPWRERNILESLEAVFVAPIRVFFILPLSIGASALNSRSGQHGLPL